MIDREEKCEQPIDGGILELLSTLPAEEERKIQLFLFNGFSPGGQAAISKLVLVAKWVAHFEKILACLHEVCEDVWKKQPFEFRADPHAQGEIGYVNRMILNDLYKKFGITWMPDLL